MILLLPLVVSFCQQSINFMTLGTKMAETIQCVVFMQQGALLGTHLVLPSAL